MYRPEWSFFVRAAVRCVDILVVLHFLAFFTTFAAAYVLHR